MAYGTCGVCVCVCVCVCVVEREGSGTQLDSKYEAQNEDE